MLYFFNILPINYFLIVFLFIDLDFMLIDSWCLNYFNLLLLIFWYIFRAISFIGNAIIIWKWLTINRFSIYLSFSTFTFFLIYWLSWWRKLIALNLLSNLLHYLLFLFLLLISNCFRKQLRNSCIQKVFV